EVVDKDRYDDYFLETLEMLTCIGFESQSEKKCYSDSLISVRIVPFFRNGYSLSGFTDKRGTAFYSILSSKNLMVFLVENGFDPFDSSFSSAGHSFVKLLYLDTKKHYQEYLNSGKDSLWLAFYEYRKNFLEDVVVTAIKGSGND
ncbi:MAG: hypothetical protein AAFY76_15255, partial [Cyanobacteria bacterium J06649_11]